MISGWKRFLWVPAVGKGLLKWIEDSAIETEASGPTGPAVGVPIQPGLKFVGFRHEEDPQG